MLEKETILGHVTPALIQLAKVMTGPEHVCKEAVFAMVYLDDPKGDPKLQQPVGILAGHNDAIAQALGRMATQDPRIAAILAGAVAFHLTDKTNRAPDPLGHKPNLN